MRPFRQGKTVWRKPLPDGYFTVDQQFGDVTESGQFQHAAG